MTKSDFEYLKYVAKHKLYVMFECFMLGIPWQGLVHDLSKFSKAEWEAYREQFFGSELADNVDGYFKKKRRKEAFDAAWLHHQHCNPHHWQYWVQVQYPIFITDVSSGEYRTAGMEVLPMPDRYIREMLADWRAMARAFGKDSIYEWYKDNSPRMILHEDTEKILRSYMTQEELYPEEDWI